jgi:predicted nuclease of restriction endonuclease-like RecB superfamily
VQLQVWEGADALVRAAARLGLPVQVARTSSLATVLDIAGPLSLYRGAAAYERALAALVPLLADHARFRLEIRTRIGHGAAARDRRICVEPPVLLPLVSPQRPRPPWRVERLAADLAGAGCAVAHEPAPIPSGDHLLFPDLELALRPRAPAAGGDLAGHPRPRVWIELVGFATDELLARKLARYEAAAAAAATAATAATAAPPPRRFALCVDATRGPRVLAGPHGPLGVILPFRRRVSPAALLALLEPP